MTRYGLDTNVVIRLLTNDDAEQREAALRFGEGLGRSHSAFLSLIVLVELDWALRTQLGFSRKAVTNALQKLLQTRGLEIEDHGLVVRALRLVEDTNADLSDALIGLKATDSGCRSTKTFDRKAASRIPGMEILT